jgi:CO/xanthine dehydrogenase FAD-binding subunit
VISLGAIAELKTFDTTRIGAAAVLDDVMNDSGMTRDLPVIPATIKVISSHLLRQSGTVGGNLLVDTRCFWFDRSKFWRDSINGCLKSEGDPCRRGVGAKECVAVFSGDLAPVLIDARRVGDPRRVRRVAAWCRSRRSMNTTASSVTFSMRAKLSCCRSAPPRRSPHVEGGVSEVAHP